MQAVRYKLTRKSQPFDRRPEDDELEDIYNEFETLDFDDEIWTMLEKEQKIIEVYFDENGSNIEYFRLDDPPSEIEAARAMLSYDLHSIEILTLEEAHDWIKNIHQDTQGTRGLQ